MCNWWPEGLQPPPKLPLTLCTSSGVLYHCGQHLKEVWKCVQLALYSLLSNPFWPHNGALLNNSKGSEKGQLQAWPQRLSADFMRMEKTQRVCVLMCTCASVCPCMRGSKDVPVSVHEAIRLSPAPSAHKRKVCKLWWSECWQRVNLVRGSVWIAACVTGLCLTIYLFKSLVPVLSQLLRLGMRRATKGRSRHQCIGK